MKNENKISTLSIVCALCTLVSVPSFAAPAVRALGGAGTYNGAAAAASNATSARAAVAGATGVRGGALRVNNAVNTASKKATNTASATRSATSPRLSVGKYLGSAIVKNNGSSNGDLSGSLAGGAGKLQERINDLEKFVGFSENGDKLPAQLEGLRIDVDKLAEDLKSLSGGEIVDVTYVGETLTFVKYDGDKIEYKVAEASKVESLGKALDDLQNRMPAIGEGLATERQLDELKTALQRAIDAKQDAGQYAEVKDLEALSKAVQDLADADFVSSADVVQLQDQVNGIVENYATLEDLDLVEEDLLERLAGLDLTPYLGDYAKKAEVDTKLAAKADKSVVEAALAAKADKSELSGFLTAGDLADLEDAVDALEQVDVAMDTAIKALQGGVITEEALNAKAAELAAADKALQDAIEALQEDMPSTEGLVNKAYVDGLVADLESADVALQNAINAISKPDVDKAYVDTAIEGLNSAISSLQGADSTMAQTIAGLESALANAATKEEVKDFITADAVNTKIQQAVAGLLTDEDIEDFVTSGDMQAEIATLATKTDIANFVNSAQVTTAITNATKDLATKAELADFVKSGDLASLVAAEVSKSDFATKGELADAKAELQAAIDKVNAGDVDLTNYYTKAEVDAKVEALQSAIGDKQDKLTAGANITITDNVIAASVDTSSFVPSPVATPTTYGEYVLMLSVGEDGKPEGYDWLDTLDLMGDSGFDM